jgi:hypothetical protein
VQRVTLDLMRRAYARVATAREIADEVAVGGEPQASRR